LYSSGFPLSAQGSTFSRNFVKLAVDNEVKFDAHASGLSIIGLILGDLNLMLKTNIICKSDEENINQNDLYMYVASRVKEKIDCMMDDELLSFFNERPDNKTIPNFDSEK
jgi:hypothetical protein